LRRGAVAFGPEPLRPVGGDQGPRQDDQGGERVQPGHAILLRGARTTAAAGQPAPPVVVLDAPRAISLQADGGRTGSGMVPLRQSSEEDREPGRAGRSGALLRKWCSGAYSHSTPCASASSLSFFRKVSVIWLPIS